MVQGKGIPTQIVAARGRQRKTVDGSLTDGVAVFEQAIEYSCFVHSGDEGREVVKATIYMDTPKGKRKVGSCELPIGSWFLTGDEWRGDLPLAECPDKRARLSLSVKIELRRELSEDEYR
jgi:hypothetical protein